VIYTQACTLLPVPSPFTRPRLNPMLGLIIFKSGFSPTISPVFSSSLPASSMWESISLGQCCWQVLVFSPLGCFSSVYSLTGASSIFQTLRRLPGNSLRICFFLCSFPTKQTVDPQGKILSLQPASFYDSAVPLLAFSSFSQKEPSRCSPTPFV